MNGYTTNNENRTLILRMQRILADFIRFDLPDQPNPRSIFRTVFMKWEHP